LASLHFGDDWSILRTNSNNSQSIYDFNSLDSFSNQESTEYISVQSQSQFQSQISSSSRQSFSYQISKTERVPEPTSLIGLILGSVILFSFLAYRKRMGYNTTN